jgi:hypothetical protein
MLGLFAAVGAELSTGQSALTQFENNTPIVLATWALIAVASFIPMLKVSCCVAVPLSLVSDRQTSGLCPVCSARDQSQVAGLAQPPTRLLPATALHIQSLLATHHTTRPFSDPPAFLLSPACSVLMTAGRRPHRRLWPLHPRCRGRQRPRSHAGHCWPADCGAHQGWCPVLSCFFTPLVPPSDGLELLMQPSHVYAAAYTRAVVVV